MFWHRKRASSAQRGNLTAFIDEGSEIEGKYTFSGTVMLNGKFQGEIASTDTLIIGERGVVNATVRAGTAMRKPKRFNLLIVHGDGTRVLRRGRSGGNGGLTALALAVSTLGAIY